jgi:hypothetical protein
MQTPGDAGKDGAALGACFVANSYGVAKSDGEVRILSKSRFEFGKFHTASAGTLQFADFFANMVLLISDDFLVIFVWLLYLIAPPQQLGPQQALAGFCVVTSS